MSRLIVISNRLSLPNGRPSTGGLANALGRVLKASGGLWIGWGGKTADDFEDVGIELSERGGVVYADLTLPTDLFVAYYERYANGVLWPLLHDRTDLVEHDGEDFKAYREANRLFAAMTYPVVGPDDLIWVHDYHLLPLAVELRSWGLENAIGFFLHVPFPSPDAFRALPDRDVLVGAIASYTVFGVQTNRDRENLVSLLEQDYGAVRSDDHSVELFGRKVRIEAFPIGVECGLAARAVNPPKDPVVASFVSSVGSAAGKKLICGIDRLDYSKGLPEKLAAFERLLKGSPVLSTSLTLLQIAPLSREKVPAYKTLRRRVEQLAGRINARHGSLIHQPLIFLNRPMDHDAVLHLLAQSHVGFIASLKDGMNLVAKEFVDVQDPHDPGVLVLSQFAGAAEEMTSALIVNPHDISGTAETLARALTMPRRERRSRHRDLLDVVERTDVNRWAHEFVESLKNTRGAAETHETKISLPGAA